MAKLVLLSVVIAMVVLPLMAGRDRSGRRGLQKAIIAMIAFNLFYLFVIRFIYPHLA